jgi:transposase
MGRSYSQDIRIRVALAVSEGLSRRAAARRFAVSESSAIRWASQTEREGGAPARKQGRPLGKGPLADHLDFLNAAGEAKPDITMPELAALLLARRGASAHAASLSRLLCRAGFSYKKTTDGLGVRTRRRG